MKSLKSNTKKFKEKIIPAYQTGQDQTLLADPDVARSILPPGTAIFRDFSTVAPDLPTFIPENCVGCMECVISCPDTAILAKVVSEKNIENAPSFLKKNYIKTTKYYDVYQKKGQEGGLFNITVDPQKCKGCAECVTACGEHAALQMIKKDVKVLKEAQETCSFFNTLPPTPPQFINERLLVDMMLAPRSLLYTGGAGSCMGCGEGTAIRMMLAATGFTYGEKSCAIVASTGCNTVFSSTYPYNPYLVSWTNSLFENSPAVAMGIRARWDQLGSMTLGWKNKKLWVMGGDGAMLDIGFQSLSRLLMSGMDINVIILDTQVYSNTGGQASTASFTSQNAKMSAVGTSLPGKTERRKEIGLLSMMHPDVFVAQTVTAFPNHFYKAIMTANAYPGPAVINVYAPCPPEHGIRDDLAQHQSKLAVTTRAFPLFIYDPRAGKKIKERLSLRGNPNPTEDWAKDPQTGKVLDFISFAKTEGRFSKQFDQDGRPSETLEKAQKDRLDNWNLLQELGGLK
ncbi:MAG: 4Fe-4S dicluster domain-containing protein [Deltaproteobacteria bacterium]|nr:4Fe-4S dicluster domain-containing protein [Deltaproteobacteria bacterium]